MRMINTHISDYLIGLATNDSIASSLAIGKLEEQKPGLGTLVKDIVETCVERGLLWSEIQELTLKELAWREFAEMI